MGQQLLDVQRIGHPRRLEETTRATLMATMAEHCLVLRRWRLSQPGRMLLGTSDGSERRSMCVVPHSRHAARRAGIVACPDSSVPAPSTERPHKLQGFSPNHETVDLLGRHRSKRNRLLRCPGLWRLVMPELGPHFTVGLPELSTLLFASCTYLLGASIIATRTSLIPIGDPRLGASLGMTDAY